MNFSTVLTTVIQLMMAGMSAMAEGFGTGINDILSHLFFVYSEGAPTNNLSVFAGLSILFWSVTLALGMGRLLLKFITGGGKNRYL